jgi:hypothetical protein
MSDAIKIQNVLITDCTNYLKEFISERIMPNNKEIVDNNQREVQLL